MASLDQTVFCEDIEKELSAFFKESTYSKTAVLVDENTKKHCYPIVAHILPEHNLIEIKSGEEQKNLQTCTLIWDELTLHAFDRKALLINIGGGVIGDMGGFCAATYKRGIDFINVPTTLLAQVDASIGGKLGIDFRHFKNHIGVFQNPVKVFLDDRFFDTLDPKELRSGYAEIIKHCLIRDGKMFDKICQTPYKELDFFELTKHSVTVKEQVVLEDPTEKGLRKILNFGHTVGHAVESFYLDKSGKKMLHGEAIAAGMICESFLSVRKSGLPQKEADRISKYIISIYDCRAIPESDKKEIIELTRQDKKNEGDKIKCSLLVDVGDCVYNIEIDRADISDAMEYYNSLTNGYTK